MAVRQIVVAVVEVFGSLLTAEAKVQSWNCTCGLYAGQSGTGAFFGFPNSLIFLFSITFYACLS
jgi:hypothetical protein